LMVDGLLTEEAMVRQGADEIHTSSGLMLRLVDDLLDTSRLDAGRIELKTDRVELTSWLARVAAGFGQATPSHRVVAQLPSMLPIVSADVDRLGQVMNNLLSNAARYSATGSEIRIMAHASGQSVEVQVVDEGTGVAVEDCERIFEKFYRGKHGATLAVRGTGLGLAVARQLVEVHGGTIGVRSTLGQGSTFWVRLPVALGFVAWGGWTGRRWPVVVAATIALPVYYIISSSMFVGVLPFVRKSLGRLVDEGRLPIPSLKARETFG